MNFNSSNVSCGFNKRLRAVDVVIMFYVAGSLTVLTDSLVNVRASIRLQHFIYCKKGSNNFGRVRFHFYTNNDVILQGDETRTSRIFVMS